MFQGGKKKGDGSRGGEERIKRPVSTNGGVRKRSKGDQRDPVDLALKLGKRGGG